MPRDVSVNGTWDFDHRISQPNKDSMNFEALDLVMEISLIMWIGADEQIGG